MTSDTAFLTAQFGPRAVARLTTPEQQQAAHRISQLLAAGEGAAIARAWMVGMNPQLDDQAPLLAVADGRFADVEVAARAYLNGNTPA